MSKTKFKPSIDELQNSPPDVAEQYKWLMFALCDIANDLRSTVNEGVISSAFFNTSLLLIEKQLAPEQATAVLNQAKQSINEVMDRLATKH